jgi:short-subunit dehydrogenase
MKSTSSKGWALVTGASAGLGAEFARQLAARGHDVILAARRRERMETLAADLRTRHGVQALVMESDLGVPGAAARLWAAVEGHGIVPTVLVNNAGFGAHGELLSLAVERVTEMLHLNVTALTELTMLAARAMAARGSGSILNVASIGAFQPSPYFAAYAATKSYVLSFGLGIAPELAPRGVRVTTLCPGATRTEFFEAGDVNVDLGEAMIMDAVRCVRIGLRAMDRGKPVVVAGWMNAVAAWLARRLPFWIIVPISGRVMRPSRTPRALPPPLR